MRDLQGTGHMADTEEPFSTWMDVYVLPDDQAPVRAAVTEAMRNKSAFQLEHRVRRTNGTVGWTLSRAAPVLDEHGAVTGWGQDDDRQRTREAGFDEHLIKPVDTREIRRVLEIPPAPDASTTSDSDT